MRGNAKIKDIAFRTQNVLSLFAFFALISLNACGSIQCNSSINPTKSKQINLVAQAIKPKTNSVQNHLRIVTYNVLANPKYGKQRIPRLMSLLKHSRADVIALQEVSWWFLRLLRREKWAYRYNWLPSQYMKTAPSGLMILSKLPVRKVIYQKIPSQMRRGVLIALLQINQRTMALANVHLESMLADGPIRTRQIAKILPLIKNTDDAVFIGDFNFGEKEAENKLIPKTYIDSWRKLYPQKKGFTWNIELSEMARKGSFLNEKSRRLDRIFIRSAVWHPQSAHIIGKKPVIPRNKEIFPSDHFGLQASFLLRK